MTLSTVGHFSTKVGQVCAGEGVASLILEMACGILKVSGHFLLTPMDVGTPRPGSSSVEANVQQGISSDTQVVK